jgi:hypothetical protein
MPWDFDKKGEFMLLTGESERRRSDGTTGGMMKIIII